MDDIPEDIENSITSKAMRAGLNIVGGAIPFLGGFLSAGAAAWSEHEQEKVIEFLKYRQQMLEQELKEQYKTIHEVMQRLHHLGHDVSDRIKSTSYQNLVQRCFRNWSDVSSETKREYVRNILVNAASSDLSKDDIIKLFIDWINQYSEFHFQVIACIYRHPNGISRGHIWDEIGKQVVKENSADADLYKLLIRDLSTGGIIRQYRATDYSGKFIASPKSRSKPLSSGNTLESAFDRSKQYVLTELGQQFVHYAMSEVSIKLGHSDDS